jgi:hypothetical protein
MPGPDALEFARLVDLGFGGRPDFGNGSTSGTALGKDTVQCSSGGVEKVYDAGSVNYILWGEMFSLPHDDIAVSLIRGTPGNP